MDMLGLISSGSMNATLNPMKLEFIKSKSKNTWDKVVSDIHGNIIFEQRDIPLNEENITKEYFDNWEAQLRALPYCNIIEVNRFI
jgi:hypothetical protein